MSTRKCLIEVENVFMRCFGEPAVKNLLATVTALACISLGACSSDDEYYVIAATGTVIGVEVSQNPATQAPQAKLGYNRGELAVVPSNRPPCVTDDSATVQCGSLGQGAKDVPDVLMELRYGGIFDTGPSSGIYQRLAVGETAVAQAGAALMFARNAEGTLDPGTAAALREAQAGAEQIRIVRASAVDRIEADVTGEDGRIDKAKLEALLDATPSAQDVEAYLMEAESLEDLQSRLSDVPLPTLEKIAANIDAS
jgi:hypothetical protein